MVIFDKSGARVMARGMVASTVEEARRVLRDEGYDANLGEIEAIVRAREELLVERSGPARWIQGERLLVVHQGAVLVAFMKEPGPEKATVRLVYGDALHETGYENLYPFSDVHRAIVKGLGVLA